MSMYSNITPFCWFLQIQAILYCASRIIFLKHTPDPEHTPQPHLSVVPTTCEFTYLTQASQFSHILLSLPVSFPGDWSRSAWHSFRTAGGAGGTWGRRVYVVGTMVNEEGRAQEMIMSLNSSYLKTGTSRSTRQKDKMMWFYLLIRPPWLNCEHWYILWLKFQICLLSFSSIKSNFHRKPHLLS